MFNNAVAYDGYIGRWSRLVATDFISWLNIPSEKIWLDVGAGTGMLTQTILRQAAPKYVVGIDLSENYIALARQKITDERAEFWIGEADKVILEYPEFDVVISGLVLNFVPSSADMLQSMKIAVRNGGTIASYVWDYAGKMEMMRYFWNAAIAIDPAAAAMDSGKQFAICHPDNLHASFEATGLKNVEVRPIDIQTHFTDFDDYWLPFLAAQGSISKYLTSLNDAAKNALTVQLRKQLPIHDDGSIDLTARAWAAKGIR